MVERGVFYQQFDAGVAGGNTSVVIPFRRPWEQAPKQPQPIDLMTELLRRDQVEHASGMGAIAPADVMHLRLANVQSLAFERSDWEGLARMRDIVAAYKTLALDVFSMVAVDNNSHTYKDEMIESYVVMQWPCVEKKGVRWGGVMLAHEDAMILQWSLEQVGINFDPGEGDICVPFTNIHNELLARAKFQPDRLNSITVESIYTLDEVPIMQPTIIEFPHMKNSL